MIGYKIYLLARMTRYLTFPAAERIYKSMILPYFDYADIFYDACILTSLTKLQRLQNRALRVVFSSEQVNDLYGVFTPEQDNDKTNVEPVHSYDAFHTRSDMSGVKGII